MIQHTHLTSWQSHAPWPKRSQLEQDLRLTRSVAAIFSDDILAEHLAMRGGTVLHKAYLPPAARYSEDIDLVLVKQLKTSSTRRIARSNFVRRPFVNAGQQLLLHHQRGHEDLA